MSVQSSLIGAFDSTTFWQGVDQSWQAFVDWMYAPSTQGAVGNFFNFLREGFGQVNALQGLLIAFAVVLIIKSWRQVPAAAGLATIATILLNTLLPVLSSHAELRLPALMDVAFWSLSASLFCGYFIVVALLFMGKRAFSGVAPRLVHAP